MSTISIKAGFRLTYVRDLLRELVMRDLRLRYKRSVLGIIWSLVNPLAQIIIFTFLFSKVLPLNIPNYPAFVFSGVLAWSWFASAISSASGAIVDNRELVRRPGFPMAVLPMVTVAANGIHYLLALPVLLIFLIGGGGTLGLTALLLPLIIVLQFCFTLGLVYLIAASHVSFRDTHHIVQIALMLGLYLTPVFYRADGVPPEYRLIYELNPMAVILTANRAVLIEGHWPPLWTLVYVLVISVGLLAFGYTIFDRASAQFVEEL